MNKIRKQFRYTEDKIYFTASIGELKIILGKKQSALQALLEIEEDEVELIMDAFMCAMMNCLLVEGYDCVKVLPCLEVWKVSNVKGEEPRKIILNGKEITQRNFYKLDAKVTRQYKKLSDAYDKILEENEFFKEDY